VTLHRIEDDLRNHAWYEALFVGTIADVEAYAARWAAFEAAVDEVEADSGLSGQSSQR
jgi:hypothetical protein